MRFRSLLTSAALAFICCLASSCSTSVVVRSDDPTFLESEQRLQRTFKLLERSSATPAERVLFLQAESFYRYRFEPPSRASASYFAEAAAAATDFPALQALAGNFDLLDLRLRASDAAIQLWETLLAHYPQTTLRPLALYRLGWSYRNTSAAGLPRKSPRDAFETLIKEQPKSELAALARHAETVSWKSKGTAATWSLLPGLGQLYVGETTNGLTRLAIALTAAAAIAYPAYQAFHRGGDLTWSRDWPLLATGLGGLIVLSFDYTSSYEDAMRGVVQWNERAEAAFYGAHPEAP